jgi:cytochrome P450
VAERALDARAAAGEAVSLDKTMAHLTADIICRTIFSTSLESRIARDVFDDFLIFERSCANVDLGRLLFGKPFDAVPQPPAVVEACARIRRHIGDMLDQRLAAGAEAKDDIVAAVIAARDPETGAPFTREELIDQIGVFFLAGHETTASSLTWAFFILSRGPDTVARIRAEIEAVAGEGPIRMEHAKRLVFTRNVFRETMRLYPPLTFLPRVASAPTKIGRHNVARGTMVMVSPWTIQRHEKLWAAPDRFDPDRFSPERAEDAVPGSYIPFGLGPRVCVGAAFATIEATLILARLVRRYDVETLAPEAVRPVARLTVRPEREIMARFTSRAEPARAAPEPATVTIRRTAAREPVPA